MFFFCSVENDTVQPDLNPNVVKEVLANCTPKEEEIFSPWVRLGYLEDPHEDLLTYGWNHDDIAVWEENGYTFNRVVLNQSAYV